MGNAAVKTRETSRAYHVLVIAQVQAYLAEKNVDELFTGMADGVWRDSTRVERCPVGLQSVLATGFDERVVHAWSTLDRA